MDEELPSETLRTLTTVLVAIFDIAREGVSEVVERLRPLVDPPDNLRIVSPIGAHYTGLLIVERNAVVAGIVIEVGRVTPAPAASREPIITPPSHYDDRGRFEQRDEREGRLPGWADDPRDLFPDEDPPWRRR